MTTVALTTPPPLTGAALIQRAARYRDLIVSLAWEDLKVRYKSPVLGFLWTLVLPLVLVVIFSFIFTAIVPVDIPHFPLFLLAGLFPWNFLALCLGNGTTVLVSHGPLIKNLPFSRMAIPLAIVLTQLVHFCIDLCLMLAVCPFFHVTWRWGWLGLPFVMGLQTLLTLGLVLLTSTLHVHYRDMKYLVEVVLTGWFYLTPIFYTPTMVPRSWQPYYFLNPMAGIVTLYRTLILGLPAPGPIMILYLAVAGIACCAVGVSVFQRFAGRMADLV